MAIAVIGWGSLIWCPGTLSMGSRWKKDGPPLPVEFARISDDGRLTLVIAPGAPEQITLWVISGLTSLEEAVENLRRREGKARGSIGSCRVGEPAGDEIGGIVTDWCRRHQLEGAVWTALPPRDNSRVQRLMTPEQAVAYLSKYRDSKEEAGRRVWRKAEEYIRSAPPQIDTPIRQRLREELGLSDWPLSPVLFDG